MLAVAGEKQLSKELFIECGLLAAGRFNLELAVGVVAQRADGLPLAAGLEIRGAQFGGPALLRLLELFALADRLLSPAQNGFDKMQLACGKRLVAGAASCGLPDPFRGFGEVLFEGADAQHGFIQPLTSLLLQQPPHMEKSFQLELESHHSAMVSRDSMVRSMRGISPGPCRVKALRLGITVMARSRSGSAPFWYAPMRMRSSERV